MSSSVISPITGWVVAAIRASLRLIFTFSHLGHIVSVQVRELALSMRANGLGDPTRLSGQPHYTPTPRPAHQCNQRRAPRLTSRRRANRLLRRGAAWWPCATPRELKPDYDLPRKDSGFARKSSRRLRSLRHGVPRADEGLRRGARPAGFAGRGRLACPPRRGRRARRAADRRV